jgi:hypothetical protein
VGIVTGLLAIGLELVSGGANYVADGTAVAFLVITLSLASHFPAEIGSDLRGAAFGAAAFGFFLFVPAALAFDNLGSLGAAGWLGLCAALVPIGYAMLRADEGAHSAVGHSAGAPKPTPALGVTVLGLVLVVVGIWLTAFDGGESFWDTSVTLGLLMLLLAVLNALLLVRAPASDTAMLAAATTFGLVEFGFISAAFEQFDRLGSGGWLEAFGGLFLLVGVLAARRTASATAMAAAPSPAAQ